jgi:hypothetical protein
MDQTLLIIIGVGCVVVIAAAFAGAYLYRVSGEQRIRRALGLLIVRKWAIVAGSLSLHGLAEQLAESSDQASRSTRNGSSSTSMESLSARRTSSSAVL